MTRRRSCASRPKNSPRRPLSDPDLMADPARFPDLTLPFAITGAAAGWFSRGLLQHPALSPPPVEPRIGLGPRRGPPRRRDAPLLAEDAAPRLDLGLGEGVHHHLAQLGVCPQGSGLVRGDGSPNVCLPAACALEALEGRPERRLPSRP